MIHAYEQGARAARSTAHDWLVFAAKRARMAEEAKANGDLVMAKRYEQQSEQYYREADKCEERAAWYEQQMGHGVKVMEAAE